MIFFKKSIKICDIRVALKKILSEQSPFYLSLWDSLTLHQKNVLRAIANFGGYKIFSQEFISASGIGPNSTLQTTVSLLIKKELIEKNNKTYEITDVFFKEWIIQQTF